MKKTALIILLLVAISAAAQDTLFNAGVIGQTTRNQKVGKGLQVTDTLLVNGKARFNGRGVAIGGNYYPSAALSITDTSKGVLVPRLTAAQMAAIASPANGLLVYNTSVNAFHFWNGSAWQLIGGGIDTTHFGHIVETGGRYGDVYNTQTDFPTKYLGMSGKGAGFWKDAPGGFMGAMMFDNTITGDSTYVHIGYINTSTFWQVGMSIEEQTDTTNAEVNLNAPTINLTASEMYIDADSVSLNANTDITLNANTDITLNANTDITLNADSNIYLNADSNIFIGANQHTSITGDSGVYIETDSILHLYALGITYIATPKLILNGDSVGIGTSLPSAKLHVNGSFKLSDGSQNDKYILTSDSNGLASWQSPDSLLPYRKYVALITQSDTNAPVATVFENTIGTMTWAYESVGIYTVSNGLLTKDKTVCFLSGNTEEQSTMVKQQDSSAGSIKLNSFGDYTSADLSDGIILNTTIEIRVYK